MPPYLLYAATKATMLQSLDIKRLVNILAANQSPGNSLAIIIATQAADFNMRN